MIVALLAAHVLVMAVIVARVCAIIVFEIVVVAVSVCMLKLHLRLDSVLYFVFLLGSPGRSPHRGGCVRLA